MILDAKKYIFIILFFLLLVLYINDKKNLIVENYLEKNIDDSSEVDLINKKLSTIQNIQIESKYGSAIYEKQNKIKSNLKFFEIGSNQIYFWYFFKNQMYYCKHSELQQTRLKKFLYPKILTSILSIDFINYYKLTKNEDVIICYEKLYENIIKKVFIEKNKIKKYEFYYENEILLIAEIIEHCKINEFYFPKKIKIKIIEENVNFLLIINEIKINQKLNYSWEIPNNKKINLKDY